MDLSMLYGRIYFDNFESVVSWLCSSVPYYLIAIFILNCLFAIFEIINRMGENR